MPTADDAGSVRESRRKLYVRQEEGASDEAFVQRLQDFALLTSDPRVFSEATGPPTEEWTPQQVEEWIEALRRTRPRWTDQETNRT